MYPLPQGSVSISAIGVLHFAARAALASGLSMETQSTPRWPSIPSQMMTGSPPQGVLMLKSLMTMSLQMALSLVEQERRATALPYTPDVYPVKFSKRMSLMSMPDGYFLHSSVV